MDLITTAIIAALAKLTEPAVKDAYDGLKAIIVRKFGRDSSVADAVEDLEKRPDSAGRKGTLQEEVATAEADQDAEILVGAKALLDRVKAQPGGSQVIQQTVTGNGNVFSGTGDVTVHQMNVGGAAAKAVPPSPTRPAQVGDVGEATAAGDSASPNTGSAKQHVFLSYCHDNTKEVAKLRDDLLAAGEQVWWDKDILPGQDWKLAINMAMKQSYAVVLCLSKETQARSRNGIYPEAMDAIGALREYAPGAIFLIPVRLSPCEIPPFEIDAVRRLDRIQYVDLFPPSKRAGGLERLVAALKLAPEHPDVCPAHRRTTGC